MNKIARILSDMGDFYLTPAFWDGTAKPAPPEHFVRLIRLLQKSAAFGVGGMAAQEGYSCS